MKKLLYLSLMLILLMGLCDFAHAQVMVEIGDGTTTNNQTSVPTPYGTYYKSFRQQYLIRADELDDQGAFAGVITGLAFNVLDVNTCGVMPNYRIRLKHTDQNVFTSTFELGEYTQVYHHEGFLPVNGWNLHVFQAPFFWDGSSNLIVELVSDLAPLVGRNATAYYTNTGYYSSLRYQSDGVNTDGYATGSVSTSRNNMRFYISDAGAPDMSAAFLSAPQFANVNSPVDISIGVMNISPDTVSDYTVKLMREDGTILSQIAGTALDHLESAEIAIPWIPTEVGIYQVFGRVELTGDENTLNNDTSLSTVNVLGEGVSVFDVGTGSEANATSAAPAPYGTHYRSFRQQYLIKADEIYDSGGAPGNFSALAFEVVSVNNCTAMTNYRIRIKDTDLEELGTIFETGEYTEVFQADTFLPIAGWNVHEFPIPYFWNGASNLIVEVVTDISDGRGQNASASMSAPGFYSSLRAQNDSVNTDTTTTGTRSLNRSNMRFYIDQSDIIDMAAIALSGPFAPNVNSSAEYTVRVMSICPETVSNYTVKLMDTQGNTLVSMPGVPIGYLESIDLVLSWTPTVAGEYHLFGMVELPGDEHESNNQTATMVVQVMDAGVYSIELGDDTASNTETGVPTPYGTHYKNFRQQYIIRADEIYNSGGTPGNIMALAFDVDDINTCGEMSNYRIRIKETEQTALISTFEVGVYTTVYQSDGYMPLNGWNLHRFQTPFFWNGASNLLVEVVTDLAPVVGRNASVRYTNTGYSSALRYQSDNTAADTSASGTLTALRANTRLYINADNITDMAAISISGPEFANVNTPAEYTVSVMSVCEGTVSNYLVKLVDGAGNTLATAPGLPIDHLENVDITLSWTPAATGDYQVYGVVEMPGDEFDSNDATAALSVLVIPQGVYLAHIGDGTTTNNNTGVPTPYGTYYKSFRQQYLIRANELDDQGASAGAITALAFNVADINTCSPMPNYRIRLKHTDQEALSSSFEVGEYMQVYQNDSYMPDNGWNTHAFQTPFFWDGSSNLLVDIGTDLSPIVGRNALTYYTNAGFNSSLRYQSDSVNAGESATGSVYANRSNMRLYMGGESANDMAALSIAGQQFANVNSPAHFTISVMNVGPDPVSNYSVKLMGVDGAILAQSPGVLLDHLESAEIAISWTPTEIGVVQVFGRVELAGDENPLNDDTFSITVSVLNEGVNVFTLGEGTEVNTTIGVPTPYGTYFQSFRQQYLIKADEIYDSGGAPGNFSGLAFEVVALNNCSEMNNYRIRLKSTTQEELGTIFETGEYTQVFQADTFMPSAGWNVHDFDAPFFWDGASNLIVEVVTDVSAARGQNASVSMNAPGFYSSLRAQSDTINTEANTTGTRNLSRSNMRFYIDQSDIIDMAAISLSGPFTPNINSPAEYTVRILSICSDTVSDYTVKLMDSQGNTLATTAGTPLGYLETADIALSWTPTDIGEYHIFGRVELAGDEHESNNETATIIVHAVDEGVFPIQLGDGSAVNIETGAPAPYGTHYKSFRQQFLIRADELYDSGGTPGNIMALAFDVDDLNTCGEMPNYRIRMKETEQNLLTSTFEPGDYTQVYQTDGYMPVVGWNLHRFQTPFFWNGFSNVLVEVVTDLAPVVGRNASARYTNMGYNCALRFQNDSIAADTSTTGNLGMLRSNMRFYISAENITDMAAISITGPDVANFNTPSGYTVSVMSINAGTVSNYIVKLKDSAGNTLATTTGVPIDYLETVEITLSWTPDELGEHLIYGVVEMPGDEFDSNDRTPNLPVLVIPQGAHLTEIGTATTTNTENGVPTPYGTYYKNFRQQFLYTADEIYDIEAIPGLISAIGFNVASVGTCLPMPNYRIRMKHTDQTALTTTFEEGDYLQVFQQESYMPTEGWNLHNFTQPFFWDGASNVIVDIVTDIFPETYTRNALVYYTNTSFNSALRYQNDTNEADLATTGTTGRNRSNTRFYLIIDDMGSLSGTVTENGRPVPNMTISVEGTTFNTATNHVGSYHLPFVPVGTHTITASKHNYMDVSHSVVIENDQETIQDFAVIGTPDLVLSETTWDFGDITIGGSVSKTFSLTNTGGGILTIESITRSGSGAFNLAMPNLPAMLYTDQSLELPITFTPTIVGENTATFTITDDQNNRYLITSDAGFRATPTHLSRDSHTLTLTGSGMQSMHIGIGDQSARIPLDFYYKSSMFQTIFSSEELDGFTGMITGIKLYNHFETELPNKPIKIWMGSTARTDLTEGWIPASEMTLVYDGLVNFPSGEHTIAIDFPEMYMHLEGGNLVMMINRPIDTNYFSSSNFFRCQTVGTSRSRHIMSDSIQYDPENMSGGNLSGQFPMITFEVIPGSVGHIEGVVRNEAGTPLPGVFITLVSRHTSNTDYNGMFTFNYLLPGDYTLYFIYYGFIDHTEEISIEADSTIELDITMQEMPQVSVMGTIIASDTGEGIEDAHLTLMGYSVHTAYTNPNGEFLVDASVYAENTYYYILTADGYTRQTGTIEVGTVDYDMGIITMEELAYAPTQVSAAINPDYSSVNLSWNPPDPDAFEMIESFEDTEFPPMDWAQSITNQGAPNMHGVRPTWSRFGIAEGISPSHGSYQAGLAWVAEHQNEWLYSPAFNCLPDAYLRFDTHLQMGSTGGDHYYVKVSTNGGISWQVLWDGAAQPTMLNSYDTPIVIDLSDFVGQEIQLAWHADDGNDGFGMYYNWFIDNIYIGNFVRDARLGISKPQDTRAFALADQNALHSADRALVGYKVWRLRSGQEDAENNWVLLSDEMLSETGFVDADWATLAEGQYLWAVKAIYNADVISLPVFSNSLFKENTNGTISGFVRRSGNNQAIAGATVSAGEYSATTMASGFYSISLPAGSYTVTATHAAYHSVSEENISVIPGENTTLNFTMTPTSNEDVVEITITALSANYPNPFNPETTISYDLSEATQVRLDVFNLKGQLVKTLVNDQQSSGRYRVIFDARDDNGNKLSSGIYFYRLRAGSYSKTRKMMLME